MKRMVSVFLMLAIACSNEKKEVLSDDHKDTVTVRETFRLEETPSSKMSSSETTSVLVTHSVLDKVEVLIPRTFKIMDEKMISVKYPLKQHSVFQVYTDEDATVNIAFEHTLNKATLQDLPAIKQVFEQQFNQTQIDFRKSEIKQINGRDFIVIEMITPAMDTEVYNLLFVTSLDGKLLMGTFNCTVEKMKEWQPLAKQILSSVKVKD